MTKDKALSFRPSIYAHSKDIGYIICLNTKLGGVSINTPHLLLSLYARFAGVGTNSNLSCIPKPVAILLSIAKLGFLVPFSILLISA